MIEKFEEEIEAQNLKKLVVLNPYGKVELKLWDKKSIKISAIKEAKGTSDRDLSEVLNEIEIDRTEASDTLEIKTLIPPYAHILNGLTLSVNYIIHTPQEIHVRIDTEKSSLSSEEGSETVKSKLVSLLMSSSKNIIKGFSGKLNVSSECGDIVVVDSEGELNINTKSGNVIVQSSKGELKIYSSSGNIDIDLFEGNLLAQSKSGNISISNTRADVLSISSKSGNIIVSKKWTEKERCKIKSESGNVRIKGHLSNSVNVWVDSFCGRVKTERDLNLREHSNAAINIQTRSGDIRIE